MLLISLTFRCAPPPGPELPSLTTYLTHTTLIAATTLCCCTHLSLTPIQIQHQTLAFHATHCPQCHHLIQRYPNFPPTCERPNVCVICGITQTTIHINAMPCPACTISSILHRRTLSTWWPNHHKHHHQSIHHHFLPITANPPPNNTPPSTPTQTPDPLHTLEQFDTASPTQNIHSNYTPSSPSSGNPTPPTTPDHHNTQPHYYPPPLSHPPT